MTPYSLEVTQNGIIHLILEDSVKVLLNIDKNTEKVNLYVATNKKILWKGKYISKKPISKKQIEQWKKQIPILNSLTISEEYMDVARTHPRHAKNYNKCSHTLHNYVYPNKKFNKTDMISYQNGLSFIGDSLIQFVLALYIYKNLSPKEINEQYNTRLSLFKNKYILSEKCKELEWDKYLAYGTKEIVISGNKLKAVYSNMMKSFIGAIYQSNGIDKLPEILEIVKNIIIGDDIDLTFMDNKYKYNEEKIIGVLIGFGVGLLTSSILFMLLDITIGF